MMEPSDHDPAPSEPEREPEGRDLGEQPVAALMESLELRAADLVRASKEQLTHKMVARACKGRRLTPNTQGKIQRALEAATGEPYRLSELFTYASRFPGARDLSARRQGAPGALGQDRAVEP